MSRLAPQMPQFPAMNLTTALVLLAAVVLVALVVQGVWQSRRAARRSRVVREAGRGQSPAQRADQRIDPSLDGPSPPAGAEGPAMGESSPDTALDEAVAAVALPARAAAVRRAGRLDPLIDAIVPLALEQPVAGASVISHLPGSRRAGTKPFHIEGLHADTGEWEALSAESSYSEFQAGVQLATRHGPLNEIEYSEFVQKIQAFADAIGATAEFPDMLDEVARARELDGFAAPHDAQLSVTLRAHSVAWSVGYVQQSAARLGFVPGAVPGRLVLPSPDEGEAPPLLVLAYDPQAALQEDPNMAALRQLNLSLDVPQTPEAQSPFAAWQQSARALADDLDADLVDDQGQAISDQAFAAIGDELKNLYRSLESRDLAAGSAAARRLFS